MKVWSGTTPPKCDFKKDHQLHGTFYDAFIPAYGCWACVCEDCARKFGIRLGTGFGQRYDLQADGHTWLKTEG